MNHRISVELSSRYSLAIFFLAWSLLSCHLFCYFLLLSLLYNYQSVLSGICYTHRRNFCIGSGKLLFLFHFIQENGDGAKRMYFFCCYTCTGVFSSGFAFSFLFLPLYVRVRMRVC